MEENQDILKTTFKKLKKKDADLKSVLDTRCQKCCRNLVLEQNFEEGTITSKIQMTHFTMIRNIPSFHPLLAMKSVSSSSPES